MNNFVLGLVRMRYIEADENLSMRGQILREAIEDDIRQGLVPFWVSFKHYIKELIIEKT